MFSFSLPTSALHPHWIYWKCDRALSQPICWQTFFKYLLSSYFPGALVSEPVSARSSLPGWWSGSVLVNGQDPRLRITERTLVSVNIAIRPEGRIELQCAVLPAPRMKSQGGEGGTGIGIPPASPHSLFLPSGQRPVSQQSYIPGLSMLSADNKQPHNWATFTELCWVRAWLS